MIDPTTDDEVAEEAERSPLKRAVVISAAVAAVAVLGSAAFYGPTVVGVLSQSDTRIATPDQVGDLTIDTSDGAEETAEYVRDAIATEIDLDKSTGAIYKDKSNPARTVILVAGTARVWKPEQSLSRAFKTVSDDSGGVRDVHDVDAGSLGGVMRCGVTTTEDGDLPVCGWADNGSVAVGLFPGRPVADAAKALLQLRDALEHRG